MQYVHGGQDWFLPHGSGGFLLAGDYPWVDGCCD